MPQADAASLIAWMKKNGLPSVREAMGKRFGIVTRETAFGVTHAQLKPLAKEVGRSHALAADLWNSGFYEARLLAAYVDEPDRVTSAQMDAWRKDFDNWATTDTVCFDLFDRTPFALEKVKRWRTARGEFQKRAAFALLASVALHRKDVSDADLLATLPFIAEAADDDRNFVWKGVAWALKGIGKRKSPALKRAALGMVKELAASPLPSARKIARETMTVLRR